MKKLSLGLFLVVATFMSGAQASEKYCSTKEPTRATDLHLFMHTFADESQKKVALRGLTDLKNNLQIGERLRIFRHTPAGYSIAMDQCVPGCLEKGFLQGFFSSECSVQVAKKDRLIFEQTYAKIVIEDVKKATTDYNIYKAVQALGDFYASSTRRSHVVAAISMVPFRIDPGSRSQLDSAFTVADTTLRLPSADFPPVRVIGAPPNKELMDFWREIFNRKKVKFVLEPF